MKATTRPFDNQIYWLVVLGVSVAVAAITTFTFYWVRELASGEERRAAAAAAAAPYFDPASANPPSAALETITKGDPTVPWLGAENWRIGVQAGQAYIQQYPQPQNVQVLTGMTTAQIWTYMQQHVSGALGVGCQYCHGVADANGNINFGAEGGYPEYENKTSARKMLLLTRDLNQQFIVNLPGWKANYVNCATCHNAQAVAMPQHPTQFLQGTPPISVFPVNLDVSRLDPETGVPAEVPATAAVPLKDAVLSKIYNYAVWKPYDPADPTSGRGTLALTYEGGRTQDQVSINQSVMNYMGWSLGQGCTYCHNSRNFWSNEIIQKVKAQRMLQMTTWLQANWVRYGAQPAEGSPVNANVPGCYTCHAGAGVPKRAMPEATWSASPDPAIAFPAAIRGK